MSKSYPPHEIRQAGLRVGEVQALPRCLAWICAGFSSMAYFLTGHANLIRSLALPYFRYSAQCPMQTSELFRQKPMKHLTLIACKIAALMFCSVTPLAAAQFGKFTYVQTGSTISITGFPKAEVGAVEIPATIAGLPVKSIGTGAFGRCTLLTSITIPEGVTSIGSEAFKLCSSAVNISVPSTVTSIGTYAFDSCAALTATVIPEGVTSISNNTYPVTSSWEILPCLQA